MIRPRITTWLCLAIAYAAAMPTALAVPVQVSFIDGSKQEVELVSWSYDSITFKTDGTTLELSSETLLNLQFESDLSASDSNHASLSQACLQLVDGTRIPFKGFTTEARQATFQTQYSPESISVPTKQIRWVQLHPKWSADDLARDQLEGDRLVVYKKKSGSFDSLDGIVGNVSPEQVEFNWDGDTIPVKREKVAALVFFQAKQPQLASPACVLHLEDGSQIQIAKLQITGDVVEITTPTNLQLNIPMAAVVAADYSIGKLTYLSDLKPRGVVWTPRVNLPVAAQIIQNYGLPRSNQSYTGSPIALLWPHPKTGILGGRKKLFEKGLALRSRTTCEYRIPKGMTRFSTTAGIDPLTAKEGHVTLELYADDRSLWQGEISGDAQPTEINVSIAGARTLKLVVDFGENLDFGDRLHLAEARFTK